MNTEPGQREFEWMHKIGSYVAAGDFPHAALGAAVSFATELVNCDSCFVYVRDSLEPVLSIWQHSEQKETAPTKLQIGRGYAAFLTRHCVPIAISSNTRDHSRGRLFEQWSHDPGETFVAVPLLARNQLMGVMNLRHFRPRPYTLREAQLLSSAGFLLGRGIGIARLKNQNSNLLRQLQARRLVEKGKAILQKELGLSEEQAYLLLQRQSRQNGKSMREIAEAVILGLDVKSDFLTMPHEL
jgi:uroporphyrinogen-III synthase